MADDLGTWPRPQAETIRDVLGEEGLTATLEPADHDVRVTVPDGQAGRAHRALAAQMGRVAAAARRTDPAAGQRPDTDETSPLVMERLRRWGAGVAVVVAVMFVAIETGPLAIPAALLMLLAIGVFRWWYTHDDGPRYGPDA